MQNVQHSVSRFLLKWINFMWKNVGVLKERWVERNKKKIFKLEIELTKRKLKKVVEQDKCKRI